MGTSVKIIVADGVGAVIVECPIILDCAANTPGRLEVKGIAAVTAGKRVHIRECNGTASQSRAATAKGSSNSGCRCSDL